MIVIRWEYLPFTIRYKGCPPCEESLTSFNHPFQIKMGSKAKNAV
jgi:hypothetical protein